MTKIYKHTCSNVNKYYCLTAKKVNPMILVMNLAQRLVIARKHAKLSQKALAEKLAGLMTQQNISLLELGVIQGTEHIVPLAIACGVRPEWLAIEHGEMVDGLYVENEKIKKAVLLMQDMPDYALDEAIKGLNSVSKLSKMAKESAS